MNDVVKSLLQVKFESEILVAMILFEVIFQLFLEGKVQYSVLVTQYLPKRLTRWNLHPC